jgi:AcrR family transcriptional regulator
MVLTQGKASTSDPSDPVLAAADRLFYRHGIQAVGMDALREEAGVSLRRLYHLYPSKDTLIEAYVRRRDERWRAWLEARVERLADQPSERPLAVFDALAQWFSSDGFRGCALVNATAELGERTPAVRLEAERHKHAVRAYLVDLLRKADPPGDPDELASQLMLLLDGAIVQASIEADPNAARRARQIARQLLT